MGVSTRRRSPCELRHGETISQAVVAGRLDVTQGDLETRSLRRRGPPGSAARMTVWTSWIVLGARPAPSAPPVVARVSTSDPLRRVADPPRPQPRSLTGRCQQRVSTTRTHQCRRSWGRCSGVVPYNRRTTRRAPAGSYWRLRQRCSAVPNRSFIREYTDERRSAPTGVGALITRRSQVQILPPPLSKN